MWSVHEIGLVHHQEGFLGMEIEKPSSSMSIGKDLAASLGRLLVSGTLQLITQRTPLEGAPRPGSP